jgi:hypothetical protein
VTLRPPAGGAARLAARRSSDASRSRCARGVTR